MSLTDFLALMQLVSCEHLRWMGEDRPYVGKIEFYRFEKKRRWFFFSDWIVHIVIGADLSTSTITKTAVFFLSSVKTIVVEEEIVDVHARSPKGRKYHFRFDRPR